MGLRRPKEKNTKADQGLHIWMGRLLFQGLQRYENDAVEWKGKRQ